MIGCVRSNVWTRVEHVHMFVMLQGYGYSIDPFQADSPLRMQRAVG